VHLVHIASSGDGNILRLQDTSGTCDHNPDAGSEIVTCSSDQRLKTNILDYANALDYLSGFHIRSYTVISSGRPTVGVIAQELMQTHPELVASGSNGYLMVQEPNPWILIKGLQELTASSLNLNTLISDAPIDTTPTGPLGRLVRNVLLYIAQVFGVNIGDKSVQAPEIQAGDRLCVGSTCLTEDQLKNVLQGAGQSAATPAPTTTPSDTPPASATPTPTDSPTPIPSDTPTPDPVPTPSDTPVISPAN
jgi:hypothetical protein